MTFTFKVPTRFPSRRRWFATLCAATVLCTTVLGQPSLARDSLETTAGSANRAVKLSTRPRIQPPSQRASVSIPYRAQGRTVQAERGHRPVNYTGESVAVAEGNIDPQPYPEQEMTMGEDQENYAYDGMEAPDCSTCSDEGIPLGVEGDSCGQDSCGVSPLRCTRWSAGVEFTLLTPHFEANPAILRRESNNAGLDTLSETAFDYGTPLSPRVWLETMQGDQLGFRLTYWQFDQAAEGIAQSPPANGFGRIQPPPFGDIDLSTTTAGSTLAAGADLNAYTIDIEATECFNTGIWGWLGTAGIRYGEVDQGYQSRLTNAAGNAQGRIDYNHRIQGVGPTMSLRTSRPFLRSLSLFGLARGSLLFGDGESSLEAIEDQDLTNPLTTNATSDRDDLLPIGELQLGLQYTPFCGNKQPYIHLALEGQVWHGAGNASSEDGNLGFFGFNVALGFDW